MFQIKDVKLNTFDLTNVKQEDPVLEIKKEKNEDQPSKNDSISRNPTNKSNKNNNFKPHNYANTDFTKYHNQSKDILYISKRLQQVNDYLTVI